MDTRSEGTGRPVVMLRSAWDNVRSFTRSKAGGSLVRGRLSGKSFCLAICGLVLVLAILLPSPGACQEPRHILILHSYHKGLTWTDSEDAGMRSVLRAREADIEVHTEYLDSKTISDGTHSRKFYELLKHKYAAITIKVVIASDDDAYNFYLQHDEQLFPGAPVVFCGVNYFKDAQREGREDLITGVVEAFDIPGTLRTALTLHPRTKRIVVINDKTTTGIANKKIIAEQVIPAFQNKVSFVFLEDVTMPELLKKVEAVPKEDIILLMTFNKDRIGRVFNYDQSIALIAKEANVPIYGVWDFYLNRGIVGGMLTSGFDQGRIAAEMVLRILDGEEVRKIPVVKESPNRYKFDYQQLKRFNAKLSDLPPDSLIINEPVTFYALHKGLVWGTTAGFFGLALIIVLLLVIIRQRRQGEETLRESEEKYRSLVDNINLGVFRSSPGPNGRFLQANPAMVKIFGYDSREDFLKIPVSDLYQNAGERQRFVEEIASKGFVRDKELAMRKKDGTPIVISVNAKAQYDDKGMMKGIIKWIDGVNEDITERKYAEEALHQSQEKYRLIVDTANEGIIALDEEHRISFVNPQMATMLDYEAEELVGRSMEEFLFQDDLPDHRQKLENRHRGFGEHYERRWRRKDGKEVWTIVSATPIMEAENKFRGSFGMILDITERKKLEEQLLHAHKMDAIGTLASGIAHDFNNILTAIVGYAGLLRLRLGEGSPLRDYADDILGASERATHLTRGLLTFSRKQVVVPSPVNLNEIIKRFRTFLERIVGEEIELTTALSDEALTVMADSGQIEQVLMNLVTNARDAMPSGGHLTIKTERVDISRGIPGSIVPLGVYAVVSVSDTGTGMDETTKQRIFEPFFTTKEEGKGTGLGLSIVYGIIKQHNGEITVYSEPGEGTTFKIYLKFIETKEEKIGADRIVPLVGGKETILVAEDDAVVRKAIKNILREYGYTVLEAVDGEDAIAVFKEHRDTVQLLLLDLVMPKKNGREAYEAIRKMRNDIRVIFSSGYTADIIQKKKLLEDGQCFLAKPATPQLLLSTVREILDA